MGEYIVSSNKDLPKECVSCSPCLEFNCPHVTITTSRRREEIVRCRDCKYAGTNNCVLDARVPFKPDAFCAWGEER